MAFRSDELRPPGWAISIVRRPAGEVGGLEAAFAAGAALAALDAAVRAEPTFAGAWRRRLALKAAAASLAGRAAGEAELRDVLALTKSGGDPGPAGRVYAAWRALAAPRPRLDEVAAGLGGPRDGQERLAKVIDAHARSAAPAPLAAAAAAVDAPAPLAFAAADLVLAAKLGWRAPLPLLRAEIGRARPPDPGWPALCCAAYARAAAGACELHAELGAAAARLQTVAPKLRAKAAGHAVAALLDEDALSGAAKISGLSDRALRRLLDRLVRLGALRELTGRPTFRLYGL